MCTYITAVLPSSAFTTAFAAVVAAHRLSFEPCNNPHVQRQLKVNERYTTATGYMCDCGSPWFDAAVEAPRAPRNVDGEVAKLLAKQSPDGKRGRKLRAADPSPNAVARYRAQAPDWLAFLERALAVRGVLYIGLVAHSYSGNAELDEITLQARARHLVEELRDGTLLTLEHDVIHEFRVVDHARRVW